MKKENESVDEVYNNHRATTMEGREMELVNLAYDAVEERIKNGSASSQELIHFLKLGSSSERLSQEKIESDMDLQRAKIEQIQSSQQMENIIQNAIDAMKGYAYNSNSEEEDY